MTETAPNTDDSDVPSFRDAVTEFKNKPLAPFGWEYPTSVSDVRVRDKEYMKRFITPRSQEEARRLAIEAAFYSLQLSALPRLPLLSPKNATKRLSRLGRLRAEDPSSDEADQITNDFLISTGVEHALNEAYEVYTRCTEADIKQLLETTAEYDPDTVGSLAALRHLTSDDPELGPRLGPRMAASSEFLLRYVTAKQEGVLPDVGAFRLQTANTVQ